MTAIQQHIAPNTMVAVRPVGARGAFHVHVTKEHIDVPANAHVRTGCTSVKCNVRNVGCSCIAGTKSSHRSTHYAKPRNPPWNRKWITNAWNANTTRTMPITRRNNTGPRTWPKWNRKRRPNATRNNGTTVTGHTTTIPRTITKPKSWNRKWRTNRPRRPRPCPWRPRRLPINQSAAGVVDAGISVNSATCRAVCGFGCGGSGSVGGRGNAR